MFYEPCNVHCLKKLLSWHLGDNQRIRSSVLVVRRWLLPGNRTLLEVASMVVTWLIVAFLRSDSMVIEQFELNKCDASSYE